MPSKYASIGGRSWSPPAKRYGSDAKAAAMSQRRGHDEEAFAGTDMRSRARRQPLEREAERRS